MEFDKVLKLRRSVRKYTDIPVSDEELKEVLDAAQTSPLAMGDDKTTHITVVKSPEVMEKVRNVCLTKSIKTGNIIEALYGAKLMIILSATDLSEDCIEYSNVACVIENIMLKATDLGVGSTYIWGCLRKLRENKEVVSCLKIPEGYKILSAVVIGHPEKPLEEREKKDKISVNFV